MPHDKPLSFLSTGPQILLSLLGAGKQPLHQSDPEHTSNRGTTYGHMEVLWEISSPPVLYRHALRMCPSFKTNDVTWETGIF